MATATATAPGIATTPSVASAASAASAASMAKPNMKRTVTEPASGVLSSWLRAQSVNAARHVSALRPFTRAEFGTTTGLAAAPSEGHIQAANQLIQHLHGNLTKLTARVERATIEAARQPLPAHLQALMQHKARAQGWVQATEKIWDFYFELFGQRQSPFGNWLLSCDRIALDCYQVAYTNVGEAKSIPAPPPFCYMRTGFSPATYRRGIPLSKLGRQLNPFPLVQLPYHRLVNPWTLGAVLHEVSHNLQNDLGLARVIPLGIARRLLRDGFDRSAAAMWTRWNRELFADLCGVLLGGPSVVASLMDVVGRAPDSVLNFDPRGVHPTPFLRTLLSIELAKRMGFTAEAAAYRKAWLRIYPNPRLGNLPGPMLKQADAMLAAVVDQVCYQPYPALGNKSLAHVIRFAAKEQAMVAEAAGRLAAGNDPGIVPERFLIGAARYALDHKLAGPNQITRQFYQELTRR